jgi:hypothetical protein
MISFHSQEGDTRAPSVAGDWQVLKELCISGMRRSLKQYIVMQSRNWLRVCNVFEEWHAEDVRLAIT